MADDLKWSEIAAKAGGIKGLLKAKGLRHARCRCPVCGWGMME